MSFSNYNENYLLGLLFTNKTIFVGYGSAATEATFTELSGGGYARVAWGNWTLTSVGGDDQYVSNDDAITFPQATGSQGTCSHIAIFDAISGGNYLGSVKLSDLGLDDISVITGTQISIDATQMKIKMD
jgi:hypothetical protein